MLLLFSLLAFAADGPLRSAADLDADHLVRLAERSEPNIAAAAATARARTLDTRRAQLTPLTGMSVGTGLSDAFAEGGPTVDAQLVVRIDVIDLVTYRNRIRTARELATWADERQEAVRRDVELDVRTRLLDVIQAEELLALAEADAQAARDLDAITTERFLAKDASMEQRYRAAGFARDAAKRSIDARAELRKRVVRLETVLGMSLQDAWEAQ